MARPLLYGPDDRPLAKPALGFYSPERALVKDADDTPADAVSNTWIDPAGED